MEQLTADRFLFSDETHIDLTVEEVRAFAERYRDNPTMLRMIKDWTIKQDKGDGSINKYADITITLPSDMIDVYKTFADGALKLADRIYKENVSENEINAYADETFGRELYAVIGNGLKLNDFKSRNIPETAKHAFDGITLSAGNDNTYADS